MSIATVTSIFSLRPRPVNSGPIWLLATPFEFTLQPIAPISTGPCVLTVADLDLDGVNDLFISDPVGRYGFALGQRAGGVGPLAWVVTPEKDCFTRVDLDGDGVLDVMAGHQTASSPGNLVFLRRICPDPCPGDVTGNSIVDGIDLAALLAAWGGGKSQFDCDVDNDGIVGGSDLAVVLAGWGACP
jgi:hypothetical protein